MLKILPTLFSFVVLSAFSPVDEFLKIPPEKELEIKELLHPIELYQSLPTGFRLSAIELSPHGIDLVIEKYSTRCIMRLLPKKYPADYQTLSFSIQVSGEPECQQRIVQTTIGHILKAIQRNDDGRFWNLAEETIKATETAKKAERYRQRLHAFDRYVHVAFSVAGWLILWLGLKGLSALIALHRWKAGLMVGAATLPTMAALLNATFSKMLIGLGVEFGVVLVLGGKFATIDLRKMVRFTLTFILPLLIISSAVRYMPATTMELRKDEAVSLGDGPPSWYEIHFDPIRRYHPTLFLWLYNGLYSRILDIDKMRLLLIPIGSLTVIILASACCWWLPRKWAILVGIYAAVYPPLVFYQLLLRPYSLSLLFTTVFSVLFCRLQSHFSHRLMLLCVMTMVLASWTGHLNNTLIPVALVIIVLDRAYRRHWRSWAIGGVIWLLLSWPCLERFIEGISIRSAVHPSAASMENVLGSLRLFSEIIFRFPITIDIILVGLLFYLSIRTEVILIRFGTVIMISMYFNLILLSLMTNYRLRNISYGFFAWPLIMAGILVLIERCATQTESYQFYFLSIYNKLRSKYRKLLPEVKTSFDRFSKYVFLSLAFLFIPLNPWNDWDQLAPPEMKGVRRIVAEFSDTNCQLVLIAPEYPRALLVYLGLEPRYGEASRPWVWKTKEEFSADDIPVPENPFIIYFSDQYHFTSDQFYLYSSVVFPKNMNLVYVSFNLGCEGDIIALVEID